MTESKNFYCIKTLYNLVHILLRNAGNRYSHVFPLAELHRQTATHSTAIVRIEVEPLVKNCPWYVCEVAYKLHSLKDCCELSVAWCKEKISRVAQISSYIQEVCGTTAISMLLFASLPFILSPLTNWFDVKGYSSQD